MAATQSAFAVVSLADRAREGEDDRGFVRLRADLDVAAFGVGAAYQRKAGDVVISEHDEVGPGADGHEELYVVVQGAATFTVDGDELDARQGTVVFVRDPAAKRKAVATEDGTIVLAIGGRRGEAYRLSPAMAAQGFFTAYQAGDYETALEACRRGLEAYPGNPFILYNVACLQSLMGQPEDALATLAESTAAWPAYKELARGDDDFAALREDRRFLELVG